MSSTIDSKAQTWVSHTVIKGCPRKQQFAIFSSRLCRRCSLSEGLVAPHGSFPAGHFCFCFLGQLVDLDSGLAGIAGDLAGPASVWPTLLQWVEESDWSCTIRFQTREFRRKVSLSFSPSTPPQWDTVQIKVADIRYACPFLIKAYKMISTEKGFWIGLRFVVQDLLISLLTCSGQ